MLATGNNTLTNYRLSIRYCADGFSFSVLNGLDSSVVQVDRFPVSEQAAAADVLRQALRKPYLMDYCFQSTELVVESLFTIVPLEHFNKSDMLAFYRLCFPSTANVGVADMQYQILSSLEAVMIFCLDGDILRILQECYPDVKVCLADAQLLEQLAEQQEKRPVPEDVEQRDVYVSVSEKRLFIAAFRRGKLQYAASQDASNDNDRAFLLLGIWRALELHPQKDALHLDGATQDLKRTLAEYILNIED